MNITYGTALANGQLGGTATWTVGGNPVTVAGSFIYTSAAGTVLGAGNGQSEAITFTPADTTDYATASTTVSVSVAQATPQVSVAPVSLTYGTALANGQLGGTATWVVGGQTVNVAGTVTYAGAAGTVLGAGNNQVEAVTFTPTDAVDYAAVPTSVIVSVAQATPTVTGVNPVSITYGTSLNNTQVSGTATAVYNGQTVTVPGTFSYTTASGTVPGAGNNQVEAVTFTPSDATDYTTALTTVSINVAQATPHVSVAPVSLTYGTALANSQLSGAASWVIGGQTVSVPGTFTYTTDAGKVLSAGGGQSEAVTFTPSDTTDYTTASATATVTVSQAATGTMVVSSANPSVYGQSVTFTATVTNTSSTGVMPTGSVQFVIDGANFGAAVPLNATGTPSASPIAS